MFLKQLAYLVALVLLACGMVLFRQKQTETMHFAFLYWNLFLALIPLAVSLPLVFIKQASRWNLMTWPLLAFWLLFFPNAPYMISDLMHIYRPSPMPYWYDPLMLASAAFSGIYSGFLSLWIVERFLSLHWPRWCVSLSVIAILLLTGLGIYLGRISRWNSWDILHRPEALFQDIWQLLTHPSQHTEAILLIVLYSLFLILNYGFWKSFGNSVSPKPELAIEQD